MKPFKWTKKGQILNIKHDLSDWMYSHAQNPFPVKFDDYIRVYFNTRPASDNGNFVSYPAFADIDFEGNLLRKSEKPVMSLGSTGCFDQFGCMSSSLLWNNDELWMYYVGWTRCVAVPYNWAIGLAVSNDGGYNFTRMFEGPVIGASHNELYLQNGMNVLRMDDGNWHIWYSTGRKWIDCNGKQESVYVIVHAVSDDGINWKRDGKPIIPFKFENETQTTPSVFKHDGVWHMFFSYRHSSDFRNPERGYRIGYAYSHDLEKWYRNDDLTGIETSLSGWDSEMVCYPSISKIRDQYHMFYCGNNFGRDGFGHAIMNLNQ